MPDSKGELKRYAYAEAYGWLPSAEGEWMKSADVLAILSTAEQRIEELEKENRRLAAEWEQTHKWNGELVKEHYALRAEREKLAGDAFRAGAVWNGRWHSAGIGSQHFPESEVDAIAAFLAQKEGK